MIPSLLIQKHIVTMNQQIINTAHVVRYEIEVDRNKVYNLIAHPQKAKRYPYFYLGYWVTEDAARTAFDHLIMFLQHAEYSIIDFRDLKDPPQVTGDKRYICLPSYYTY